jgi:hypothetical protein
MIDAVLSYHMNPDTCGVAKFNWQLAKALSVPFANLSDFYRFNAPLVSIKPSEIGDHWRDLVPTGCTLLLHERLSYGSEYIPPVARLLYADEIGCPSTIQGNATRAPYRVLTLGMAHKRVLHHFRQLKQDLDNRAPDYTLEASMAIHEGTPWDKGLNESIWELRQIFGDKLRVLGFLADDAIARLLTEVDAVAVFYEPALRANHTAAMAAMAAGKTLYTNRDEKSPTGPPPTWDTWRATLA